jgi:hypothetical protein
LRELEVEEDGLMAKLAGRLPKTALTLAIRKDLALFGHEDPAPRAALEHAVADEFLVGAGDGIGIDDERLRQDADGGELFADLEPTEGDSLLNLLNDLAKDGDIAGRRDGESERHGCINSLIHSEAQELFLNAFRYPKTDVTIPA